MIRFLSDAGECRAAWDRFSPAERVWDNWQVMSAFHNPQRHRLHFLLHETDGATDGLIPLVHDTSDDSYELFGGCYADGRILWIQPEHFPECYQALPDNTAFFDLNGTWVDALLAMHPEYESNFVEKDDQFYLVPADFQFDFTNHINTFSSDRRRGFLRDLRKVRERNPGLTLNWSNADESDLFIELSIRNFGEDSDYIGEAGQAEVHRVVRVLQSLDYLNTLTISIDGVKQGTSLSSLYNNRWVMLYAASNNDYDSLGKFLNAETIQQGCRLGVDEVNLMTGTAWKANWNMKRAVCRTLRKPPRQPGPGDATGT